MTLSEPRALRSLAMLRDNVKALTDQRLKSVLYFASLDGPSGANYDARRSPGAGSDPTLSAAMRGAFKATADAKATIEAIRNAQYWSGVAADRMANYPVLCERCRLTGHVESDHCSGCGELGHKASERCSNRDCHAPLTAKARAGLCRKCADRKYARHRTYRGARGA